jgi:hypothetical protein
VTQHYIVKIRSGHGAQYAHVEYPAGQQPELGSMILEIDAGPADTAGEAWTMWHVKMGSVKA